MSNTFRDIPEHKGKLKKHILLFHQSGSFGAGSLNRHRVGFQLVFRKNWFDFLQPTTEPHHHGSVSSFNPDGVLLLHTQNVVAVQEACWIAKPICVSTFSSPIMSSQQLEWTWLVMPSVAKGYILLICKDLI